jgi:hypothetical protein
MTYSALAAVSTFENNPEFPDPIPQDDEHELSRWLDQNGLGEAIPDNDNFDAGNISISIDQL